MAKQKVILDVDTGVDDAQAIMMAITRPDLDVIAITTVNGNCDVDKASINTLRVLKAWGRLDIPVYKGAVTSLMNDRPAGAAHMHGMDGLGDAPDPDPPSKDLLKEDHAVIALIELVNKYPGEITIVALGPLTNIAMVLRLNPSFGSKLKDVFIMGGNREGKGNTTTSGEFNFLHDPEGAKITLEELGCPISILPWETCHRNTLPWDWLEKLSVVDTPKGRFHSAINAHSNRRKQRLYKNNDYYSCDPAAMCVAIDKSSILESTLQYCTVETGYGLTRGQMVVDWNGVLKKKPNVNIVMKVDLEKLKWLYEDMLK